MRTKALVRDIARRIKVAGIARLDLTADEFAAIKDAPELRALGVKVTATPEALAAGSPDIGRATRARVCWTGAAYRSDGPVEAAFPQYAAAEIVKLLRALAATAAGSVWDGEARLAAANEKKKAAHDTRRTRAREMFNRCREKEPAAIYAKGPLVEKIARRLRISPRTAKTYLAGLK